MLLSTRLAVALVLGLAAAGCRQPDGQAPTPTADQTNEIGDIARDMINVVNKDPQGPEDLRADLSKYGQDAEATAQIDAFARQLTGALADARLDDATAERLAKTLWVAVTARDLSARQIDALEQELEDVLASAGVPEERAQPIANRLDEMQRAITDNPKRWYQVF